VSLPLNPVLAELLGLPIEASRGEVAEALARVSQLPAPMTTESRRVLSEIVHALQHHVIDFPDMPMDRAIIADFALSYGCDAAGREAVQATFVELGGDALDWYVRRALHSTLAPELAKRGTIRLVGG
jgi:hypothetical protein